MTVEYELLRLKQINLVAQHTLNVIHLPVSVVPTGGHERSQRMTIAIESPELVQLPLPVNDMEPPRYPPHAENVPHVSPKTCGKRLPQYGQKVQQGTIHLRREVTPASHSSENASSPCSA